MRTIVACKGYNIVGKGQVFAIRNAVKAYNMIFVRLSFKMTTTKNEYKPGRLAIR